MPPCGNNALRDQPWRASMSTVRLYCTIHHTYVFEDVKRTRSFDDMYDVGNLLLLGVHHCMTLTVRRPHTATLMIEDNLKDVYKMFTVESKVNQVLDINSLYLSWMLVKDRKKDFDRKIVMLPLIMSEGRMFLKGFFLYLLGSISTSRVASLLTTLTLESSSWRT